MQPLWSQAPGSLSPMKSYESWTADAQARRRAKKRYRLNSEGVWVRGRPNADDTWAPVPCSCQCCRESNNPVCEFPTRDEGVAHEMASHMKRQRRQSREAACANRKQPAFAMSQGQVSTSLETSHAEEVDNALVVSQGQGCQESNNPVCEFPTLSGGVAHEMVSHIKRRQSREAACANANRKRPAFAMSQGQVSNSLETSHVEEVGNALAVSQDQDKDGVLATLATLQLKPKLELIDVESITNLQTGREALDQLDVQIQHSIMIQRPNGQSRSRDLTVDEIKCAVNRRVLHARGAQKIQEWARMHYQPWTTPGAAYAFWFDKQAASTLASPQGQHAQLPWCAKKGLESAVSHGSFDCVFLVAYQTFENLPEGIVMTSAEEHLPFELFRKLCNISESVANTPLLVHLADFIRLSACMHSHAKAAWFIDADTIWVKSACPQRVVFGHAFASFAQNPGGHENYNPLERKVKSMLAYARSPHDDIILVSPFRFPQGSPMLASVVDKVHNLIYTFAASQGQDAVLRSSSASSSAGSVENPFHKYTVIMECVMANITAWGLESAIQDSIVFSPVPYYVWAAPLRAGTATQGVEGARGGGERGGREG